MEDTKPSGVVARHGVLRLPPGFSCVAVPSGDWVLCRVFKKKRATKMEAETDDGDTNHGVGFIDFMGQRDGDGSHSATSVSEASCVTYGSSSGEETSSGTSLP
ncbi:hypothetical protein GW17_00006264 [Ensete ventricosum]|nr:hypothetical protein GW17_00006264 [Ensete ventricosum]